MKACAPEIVTEHCGVMVGGVLIDVQGVSRTCDEIRTGFECRRHAPECIHALQSRRSELSRRRASLPNVVVSADA